MSDKQKNRYFTILVIPHNEETVLNLRIPLYLFQIISILLVSGLVFGFVWLKSMFDDQHNPAETSRLLTENRILHEDIDRMTRETEELMEYMKEVESLTLEVRKIIDLPVDGNENEGFQAFSTNNDQVRLLASRGGNPVIERNSTNISHLQGYLPELNDALVRLKEDVIDYNLEMAATPSIWPTRGRVTSEFGPRLSPFSRRREFHYGIDIAGPRGTPIYATADGNVVLATYRRGMGNTINISHGYGYRTVYAHLSGFAVTEGQSVEKGDLIGYMGSTGFSTGPHLHYEVHVNGIAVDPRSFFP